MRHVYARGIIAMIWLIAASVSGASGKTADAVRYVILGGFFSIPRVFFSTITESPNQSCPPVGPPAQKPGALFWAPPPRPRAARFRGRRL